MSVPVGYAEMGQMFVRTHIANNSGCEEFAAPAKEKVTLALVWLVRYMANLIAR